MTTPPPLTATVSVGFDAAPDAAPASASAAVTTTPMRKSVFTPALPIDGMPVHHGSQDADSVVGFQARGRFRNTDHAGFFTFVTVSRPDCQPVICGWSRTRNQSSMSIRGFARAIAYACLR